MDFIDYVCYILLFLAIGGILGTALLDPQNSLVTFQNPVL